MSSVYVFLDWGIFCFLFVELLFRTAENRGETPPAPPTYLRASGWYSGTIIHHIDCQSPTLPAPTILIKMYHIFFVYREKWSDMFSRIL